MVNLAVFSLIVHLCAPLYTKIKCILENYNEFPTIPNDCICIYKKNKLMT